MSERRKQIEFLKTLVGQQPSCECRAIREKIQRAEREERFLRRMIFLLLVLMLFSLAGLGYGTVFGADLGLHLLLKLSCSLGLASLISLVAFTGYWLWHRLLLNGLYHECRRVVMTALREADR